ncbi:16S rRNA (guanine(966)-N(2))-methyltransferase RsmD [Alicyclobacillus shizuokensis]|uniref:16S rRNA (guanine(966)-N(2))-methyltransferase RsmD n=1 Tax=Alicyclobacillus shizuokensis TaxID=392014 RepID=UPI0008329A39|nr:16S rRNA (guanine(966)-N(2))-methyltransferase RsmD [Alicyclobacillus shizuokensis]MCL6627604.1 16S rRNA (guanine(966)-N(2))-methyltransferase RsmD [Alicyclobacillus shizuokensis]
MRIIAGRWRGRRLFSPPGLVARPTTDRVKESMFNLLGPFSGEEHVLDLFAGSGALGLEALSRGAEQAVFVDRHPQSIATIRRNVAALGAAGAAQVWKMDWRSAWTRLTGPVDWVFVDPPYRERLWLPVLEAAAAHAPGVGGVVCEHPHEEVLPDSSGPFSIWKARRYGDIQITIYVRRG